VCVLLVFVAGVNLREDSFDRIMEFTFFFKLPVSIAVPIFASNV
jgi:hypothetical protein